MIASSLPCFEAAEAFGEPVSVSCDIDLEGDIVHETHLLRVHNWRDYVSVHVDYAYPAGATSSTPCLLFNPGGRGRSQTDLVRWLARSHGIAAMSYDWPGRHRSPTLMKTRQDIDPAHAPYPDPRLSYFYSVTNAAAGVYRFWTKRSEGRRQVLAGSSWGGVMSLLLSAAYDAHSVAYAEFGCGHFERQYPKRSYWDMWMDRAGRDVGHSWREMFDPANFLANITKPVIMATSSNDKFFSLDMFVATWQELNVPKSMLVVPNTDHSMRSLNHQLYTFTKALGASEQRDYSVLKTLTAEETFATKEGLSNRVAWFGIDRARNNIGRLWSPRPVLSLDDYKAAEASYLKDMRHLLRPGDRLASYIMYDQSTLGEVFTFSTAPKTVEISADALAGGRAGHATPAWIDCRPLCPTPFEDRVPYRENVKVGDPPDVLRFPVAKEGHRVTITGILFPPNARREDFEIRLQIEVIEPLDSLQFCLLSQPELADERAWAVDVPVTGVAAGEVIDFIVSVENLRAIDLYEHAAAMRRLKRPVIDKDAQADLDSISACCFWVVPSAGGAIRVVELDICQITGAKLEIEDPFSLMTVQAVINAFAGRTIPTKVRPKVMERRLRAHEPWRYGLRFSNGVDTAGMQRMKPFVANIHEKIFIPWPWLVKRLKPGFSVLDVGSGIGHHRFTFRALGCGAYTGIEASSRNAEVCETVLELTGGLAPGDRFIYEDAAKVDPGARFDLVVCLAVINNIVDAEACLRMMRKAVKPGGTLLLETLLLEFPPDADPYTPLRPDGYMYDKTLCWIPTMPGLERSLTKLGFTDIEHKLFWRNAEAIGEGMAKVFTIATVND